ncbi:MAG: patatin-like phospholipase family protein [Bacteroidales bacterium]|nr:patatin-like phospholipase family protein [Bacteroidales bacterium]
MKTIREKSYDNLEIPEENKTILCLDGGGIRGILTLQLLKKLEEIAEIPCYQLFDMVAGSSAGAIIAGLIASGKTAVEIEDLYKSLVTKVFKKRSWNAHQFINPPLYDKENYREALVDLLGNNTLKDICARTNTDLLITAKDITANEETFFTCFEGTDNNFHGTYQDVLIRAVLEATMSAPTYFHSLERFIDGGSTTYNNPSLATLMEAVRYEGTGKYQIDKLTMFSLGTGMMLESIPPDRTLDPEGVDTIFWLNLIMREASNDACNMQVDSIRSGLFKDIDYRRFDLSLDTEIMNKIPNRSLTGLKNIEARSLKELTTDDLSGIELDDVSRFPLLEAIGQSMVDYIMNTGNAFTADLVDDNGNDLLMTHRGDIERIKGQMGDSKWLEGYQS